MDGREPFFLCSKGGGCRYTPLLGMTTLADKSGMCSHTLDKSGMWGMVVVPSITNKWSICCRDYPCLILRVDATINE